MWCDQSGSEEAINFFAGEIEMDEPTIYNLSQDNLLEIDDDNTGTESLFEESEYIEEEGMTLTANDLDANHYQAEVAGEEAVGGLTPTPEQSIVEDLAVATGVQTDDNKPLRVRDRLEQRDEQRWELDPDSAEDH